MVCAVKLGRVFAGFHSRPIGEGGQTDHQDPRPPLRDHEIRSSLFLGFLELEIVTGKLLSDDGFTLAKTGPPDYANSVNGHLLSILAIDRPCPVSIIYHTHAIPANSFESLGKLR